MQMYPSGPEPSEQDAITQEWWSRAFELVAWILLLLVNRGDVHGGYYTAEGRVRPTTRRGGLNKTNLLVHFAAEAAADVVGAHATAPDETCRWLLVDIDKHRDDDGADPEANFRFALLLLDRARGLGFSALLIDSNGRGGYHLWVIFGRPVPAAAAWRLGKYLVRDFAAAGLARAPETFPKAPGLSGKRIGNWVRLPGRHPGRGLWSRVWGGDRWLEGAEAAAAILATGGSDADPARVVPDDFDPRPRRPGRDASRPDGGRRSSHSPTSRPVDLTTAPAGAVTPRPEEREVARAREALGHLNGRFRDDYDSWLRVGLALRQLGDDGRALWHWWSAASPKYDPAVLDAKWAGFAADAGPGRVGLGTVFHWATAAGWAGPARAGRPPRRGSFRIATTPATPRAAGTAGEGSR